MAAKKSRQVPPRRRASKPAVLARAPRLFRLNIEVGDLDRAAAFYSELLGIVGRRLPGNRVYFDCEGVTLQVVQVPGTPHVAAESLYFVVDDLDAVFVRARSLASLSAASVHGAAAGEMVVRPWGERSFYCLDPWLNPLCFVAAGTVYDGHSR